MKGWYMIKIRVFLKSIVYSLNLTYKSCGFLLIGYVFISIIEPTLALAVTYETKLILDHLIGGSSISQIIFRILCYIGILIATQLCASVRKDVRKLFSALFQTFVQYPLTLRENIALSDLERLQNDEEIIEVLNQSEVYEDIKLKLENGLDSFMTRQFDDKGTELSKGQWQKVALSRAYFKNASIIIFDEPSAALDAEAEDRIFRNFEEISEGKTGIMISHRISSSRMSNKIIVLDGGKITEQGTHDELVAKDGLYAKLYNLQREKYTMQESGETV